MRKKKFSILIGITAGIAAYKIIDLISLVRKNDIQVAIMMTKNAQRLIDAKHFQKVVGKSVYTDLFPIGFDYRTVLKDQQVEHIKIADSIDLIVIAPATADIIGKVAHGIADDLLTTTIMASTSPVLICPSMNTNMWNNPAVQMNLSKLKKMGYFILQPDKGRLACGYFGVGRLVDTNKIFEAISENLNRSHLLKAKKIIVTAGATIEQIDAVRIITNKSSGKMGVALADQCFLMGANVLLLRSKSSLSSRYPIRQQVYETSSDLEKLIKDHVKNKDVLIHTAAVSDFLPKKVDGKISSKKPLQLALKPAVKILHQIKKWNPKICLIGFKAVYGKFDRELVKIGVAKLKESKSDYIIVNDIAREGVGFAVDTNEVFIVDDHGLQLKIAKAEKDKVAKKILTFIFLK